MADEDPIDPEQARARFRRAQTLVTIVITAAFVLQMAAKPVARWLRTEGASEIAIPAQVSTALIMLIAGIAYARLKGRSGWWGAIGILGCIGYFVLLWLKKHCLRCGTAADSSAYECPSCRAPI